VHRLSASQRLEGGAPGRTRCAGGPCGPRRPHLAPADRPLALAAALPFLDVEIPGPPLEAGVDIAVVANRVERCVRPSSSQYKEESQQARPLVAKSLHAAPRVSQTAARIPPMPTGTPYVALLRGINVGGKNLIKMADLRAAFEAMGFADVATFIASGNVLFRAPRQRSEQLAARIESELDRGLGMQLKIVLMSEAQLRGVVEGAPRGFGAESDRCDVIFVRKPLTVRKAFGVLDLKEGVDRAWAGTHVLYHSRLAARASSSRLANVVMQPEYQNMTIRSWSTTTKLFALMDSRSGVA
jgi:uncharacterized protein (DUF1697 family)